MWDEPKSHGTLAERPVIPVPVTTNRGQGNPFHVGGTNGEDGGIINSLTRL